MWNFTLSFDRRIRMSSCFFSSRLKMRISRSPEWRNLSRTAFPKEPVPPVMRRTLPSNIPILHAVKKNPLKQP